MLNTDDFQKAAPGIIGSVIAMLWSRDKPARLVAAAIGGSTASYYGAAAFSHWLAPGANLVGFVGFLIGIFAMAIGAKIFEVIEQFDLQARLAAWLDKRGL